jgi:hypothetical protein
MGENPSITRRASVDGAGLTNTVIPSPSDRHDGSPTGAGARDRVMHRFSPDRQDGLIAIKSFGIIALFGGSRGYPRR